MISNHKDLELGELNSHNLYASHIVYVYNDIEQYFTNAVNYLEEGIRYGQGAIFVDSIENIAIIRERILKKVPNDEILNDILFLEEGAFYSGINSMDNYATLTNLSEIMEPFTRQQKSVRTWGTVGIDDIAASLKYEQEAGQFVKVHRLISMCVYDGNKISASMLTELLKNHDYYMTDSSLVKSPFSEIDEKNTTSVMEQINREKSAQNEVMRSEQLAFAGQFAAGICHEIRNPLTTIKGFFQLIKESNQKDKYYEVIDNELDRIEKITSELLLLSRPHGEQREIHNLIGLINDVKILMDTQAIIKSIEILTEFESEDLHIECEDTKMKQVFINMVKNAIEIMDKGRITIAAKKDGDYAKLSIKDEGPGITEEDLKKIGQPFFTTKQTGTGLGLTICFNIIKSHGGTVEIDSILGEGTTFTIKLPLVK